MTSRDDILDSRTMDRVHVRVRMRGRADARRMDGGKALKAATGRTGGMREDRKAKRCTVYVGIQLNCISGCCSVVQLSNLSDEILAGAVRRDRLVSFDSSLVVKIEAERR